MSVLERIDLSISIKKKIHIHYTDIDGEESIRWVAVERRFSEGGGGRRSRKWIEGYCHLRKDKRIFRIDRIRTVEIYGYKGAPIN